MNGEHRASNVEAELCGGTISNKMCEETMVVGGYRGRPWPRGRGRNRSSVPSPAAIQFLYECFVCYIFELALITGFLLLFLLVPNYTLRRLVAKAY